MPASHKRVQFSCRVEFVSTFANEDYDRTAQEVAKLSYHDMLELLTLKSGWRKETQNLLAERALKEEQQQSNDVLCEIYF
ncbi:hypothetical protein DFQ28_004677 [Apophysomyces sp. BC1034]|nr:hypothetical protein DFQ30_007315 [Apophysomyces sp. BC1015]KAG0183092.1 hypothetical protein DFQ29_000095 [Apophysomyces sp. BC1021]KAG0193557.1 hypothetical protein DFQ28_004677 [Apophysomyces sp. BC1034]